MGFISWISPIKYSTSSFVANFSSTKSFGLSGWVVKSTPSSKSPCQIVRFVRFVGGAFWIRGVGVCLTQFCNICLNFLSWFGTPGLDLGVPLRLLFAAEFWIPSFWGVRVTILYFPFRCPPLLLTLGAVVGYGRASSWSHLLFQRASYLYHRRCCQAHWPCC